LAWKDFALSTAPLAFDTARPQTGEDGAIGMTAAVAERLEGVDPGFVRSRRGVRAVCATVLAWATMVAVTAVFDVADPVRITLLAAGAAFEGALLAPDPQPIDRVRTLGWASVVAAVAVVVTVALAQTAVWVAAALLVLLMFSSYALRSWSPRVASLAPKPIEPKLLHDVDVVVTLGREAHVDPTPGTRLESWDTDEPSERGIDGIERMRLVRDDIAARVGDLYTRLQVGSE
jgi:hypothetical protein